MTVVLVHGNPETDAVWDPVVEVLGRDDVVRLSPPGFGAPLPDGWPATYLHYRDWLEDELAKFEGPIDLVGHDWGGGHVVNVVMHRPALVRSWASDIIGIFDPDYVWHDLAQVWQTPGDGEALVETMMSGTLQDRAEQLLGLGLTHQVATKMAAGQGPEMGRAILALYRSATQPVLAEAGRSWRKLLRDRDCRFSPPRITTLARTRSAAEPPSVPVPAPRCWTVWATGGWCRTRRAPRPCCPNSGTQSPSATTASV